MKRTFILAVIVIFHTSIALSALAASEPVPKILVDTNGQGVIDVRELFWISKDTIFFADGADRSATIYRWKIGDDRAYPYLPDTNNLISSLQRKHPHTSFTYLPFNDGFCAFSLKAQIIYLYHNFELKNITDFMRTYDIREVYQVVLDEADLYLHVDMSLFNEKTTKKVIRLNLLTGNSALVPIDNIDWITAYKNNMLLVQVENEIMSYDPESNRIGDKLYHTAMPNPNCLSPFIYDPSKDVLINVCEGDLYQIDACGQAQCIRVLEKIALHTSTLNDYKYEKENIQGLYLLENGMVGLLKQGILSVFWPQRVTPSTETLHVVRSIYPIADSFYQLKNPSLQIEYCLPVGSYMTLSDLQKVGHPVDVFDSSSAIDLLDLIKERKVQSLHSSALIDQLVATYLPSITKKICDESLPMALPYMLNVHLWEVSDEKWTYNKLPPPPTSFDELQRQMEQWDEVGLEPGVLPAYLGNGGMSTAKASLAMLLTLQYIEKQVQANGFVNFMSDEYRDLIETIIDLPNITTSETGTMLRGMLFRRLIFAPIDRLNEHVIPSAEYENEDKYSYILPLKLYPDEGASLMGRLSALCLSKDSINTARAIDYLAFIAQYQNDFEFDTIASFQGKLDYGYSELNLLYSQIISNIKIERPFIDALQYEFLDSIFESFFDVNLTETNFSAPISQNPFSADEIDGLLNLLSAYLAS